MFGEKRVVDNRVFLLGLDVLYRDAMKGREAGELLPCARRVAQVLGVPVGEFPVEGYYAESPELTEYFHLVRSLQAVDESSLPRVESLPEFGRLLSVVSSKLFGRPVSDGKLLPKGRDPLSQALEDSAPDWTVESLIDRAGAVAGEWDDCSLVGLAARCGDAVVLTATRESVVLYARTILGSARRKTRYVWDVDKDLSEAAGRFIEIFNGFFGDGLPAPKKSHAEVYWQAYRRNEILGRCVRIGSDPARKPAVHYHWAACEVEELTVHEFWHPEVWTTERYRTALQESGKRPRV